MMQRFAVLRIVLLSVLVFPLIAQADTVTSFNLSGSVQDQALPLSGTMTVDTTTGTILAVAFGFPGTQAFPNTSWATDVFANYVEIAETFMPSTGSGFESIDLLLPVPTLVGYSGGDVCSVMSPCSGQNTIIESSIGRGIQGSRIEQASLTPVAPTPEPSSLALVGTGAAGIAGWMGRKIRIA